MEQFSLLIAVDVILTVNTTVTNFEDEIIIFVFDEK